MYGKKPKNDMDQPGKEASSEVQEMASTDSGETEADGTGGEEAAAGESHPGFETIPETEPADSEETEPVVYTIPDGVNNPVAPATDYGNTNTAYQAPAGTVFETATSGMFAPDGTFYYLQSVPDDSYFSDALFIGDSRTDGFRDYSSLKDVASFWAKVIMRSKLCAGLIVRGTSRLRIKPADCKTRSCSGENGTGSALLRKYWILPASSRS